MTNYKVYPVLLGWVIDDCLLNMMWKFEAVFSVERPRLSEPTGFVILQSVNSSVCVVLYVFSCLCV